jgi:hypothetical protein
MNILKLVNPVKKTDFIVKCAVASIVPEIQLHSSINIKRITVST